MWDHTTGRTSFTQLQRRVTAGRAVAAQAAAFPSHLVCFDLLHDGLIAQSGTGDVRVQPMPGDASRVQLELSSPSGHAVFTTCAQTLGDFLHRTFEAVPPDTEYSWLYFDLALSGLLNDPARD